MTATMARELWHERSGPRLPDGPGGDRRRDGSRYETRGRRPTYECFRCAEIGDVDADRAKVNRIRRLTAIRVVAAGSTLGSALLCSTCILGLTPLDPDPLTVVEIAG